MPTKKPLEAVKGLAKKLSTPATGEELDPPRLPEPEQQELPLYTRQTQFLTFGEVLDYVRPWPEAAVRGWAAERPDFPKPIRGEKGRRIYSRVRIDAFLAKLAKDEK